MPGEEEDRSIPERESIMWKGTCEASQHVQEQRTELADSTADEAGEGKGQRTGGLHWPSQQLTALQPGEPPRGQGPAIQRIPNPSRLGCSYIPHSDRGQRLRGDWAPRRRKPVWLEDQTKRGWIQ